MAKHYVVILPNNLGDVIMTLPVLGALKRTDPTIYLSFLVDTDYEAGLLNSPLCDRIILLPRKQIKEDVLSGNWRTAVKHMEDLAHTLNVPDVDVCINLSQNNYVSYIATLVKAGCHLGRQFLYDGIHAVYDVWSQYLYAVPFARSCNKLHATDIYCRIAGMEYEEISGSVISVTEEEMAAMHQFLQDKGRERIGERKILILQPGAAYSSKRWPEEYFIELGKRCTKDGYFCIITGAPAEKNIAEKIAKGIGEDVMVTAGEITFRQTIALCTYAKYVITGDTAIMHAAAALKKKVIALFGPTNPVETGPYGTGHIVLSGMCDDGPCFKTECPSMRCMRSITPDAVYAAITGNIDPTNSVQVFRTKFTDGLWGLEPISQRRHAYFDMMSAEVIYALFAGKNMPDINSNMPIKETISSFITLCVTMEQVLLSYLKNGNREYLRRFEIVREQTAQLGGCAVFLNTILNIRFNSISLRNPYAGILQHIAVCRDIIKQITGSAHDTIFSI